jgi:hypothetical protein
VPRCRMSHPELLRSVTWSGGALPSIRGCASTAVPSSSVDCGDVGGAGTRISRI